MARINIVHATEYTYRNPVGLLRHRMMMRPDDSHDLRLHRATLEVDPEPASIRWAHDAFDNSICFLEWPGSLRTKRLSIVSTLDLTHHPDGPPLPVYSLDPAAELFPFSYAVQESSRPGAADRTAIAGSGPHRRRLGTPLHHRPGNVHTLDVMEAMTHAIKAEFDYGARHEEGTQTAAETLALEHRNLPRLCRADDGSPAQLRSRCSLRHRILV